MQKEPKPSIYIAHKRDHTFQKADISVLKILVLYWLYVIFNFFEIDLLYLGFKLAISHNH